jgi:hypothetical protein
MNEAITIGVDGFVTNSVASRTTPNEINCQPRLLSRQNS